MKAEPILLWELIRALASIAAWFVLFYRLHRPEALWRRLALLVVMPLFYTAWMLIPRLGTTASERFLEFSWAAIILILAFLAGNLRRSLFTALFYIGMEDVIDQTRSALIAFASGGWFPFGSTARYVQFALQYAVVFALCALYARIMRRRAGNPPLASWLLTIAPCILFWALYNWFDLIADPLLTEQGINFYGPVFCFGLLVIIIDLGVFYVYTRLLVVMDSQALALAVTGAPPVWSPAAGLAEGFRERCALTRRETEIVDALMRGKSNKEIADTQYVSLKTVETHLSNIYRKTGAPNRLALSSLINGAFEAKTEG